MIELLVLWLALSVLVGLAFGAAESLGGRREVIGVLKYRWQPVAFLLVAFLLAGCATGGPKEGGIAATYVHPATGDTKVCYEQNAGMLVLLCIPCAFAQAGSAFADCKSDLESKGYERQR